MKTYVICHHDTIPSSDTLKSAMFGWSRGFILGENVNDESNANQSMV